MLTDERIPIWMAALLASNAGNEVAWQWHAGRAVYTNRGAESAMIEAFGLEVQRGESVAVTWIPGETAYTVERLAA
jgi:anthranilate phosphoribosyltransferase